MLTSHFRARGLAALLLFAASAGTALAADSTPPPSPANAAGNPVASLDDLFSEEGAQDVAVSPSGKLLGAVIRRKTEDVIVVMDLTTGDHKIISRAGRKEVGPKFDAHISTIYWKTDERLLFRVTISPSEGVSWRELTNGSYRRLGRRLFAVDRDGKNLVRLLGENRNSALDFAFDLGAIRSLLTKDPENILMVVDGEDGRSLFKVNVNTGKGEQMERANPSVHDWWLDLDGKPVVRVEVSLGTLRYYRREDGEKWKKFYSVRLKELQNQRIEYDWLGASTDPNKVYVLARPEGAQRYGVYLYDLKNESFGAPVAENAQYDISNAWISRDGTKVLRYCYLAHVRICESSDSTANAHMRGLRKYFNNSANVYVVDSSQDLQTLLLFVEGPSDAPAYYEYQLAQRQINLIGLSQQSLDKRPLPTATVLEYAASDGLKVHGYLTRPPGADKATQLPLIVMPHGGPEARDYLSFDLYAQFFASRGYAVFQPNFRGSDGFGLTYTESGYGQWGRKMQDDITDGVRLLIEQKTVDPRRICIVGASYGGYAALAGATLTPDLYQCAVSIAGITDLDEFLKARRRKFGSDSEIYLYWVKQIGDPQKDAERIASVSPAMLIDKIKAPILLVHGDDDQIVPYAQSTDFKKKLDKSGRKTELITLEEEDHSGWSSTNERKVMDAIAKFVTGRIGPGAAAAPAPTASR